MKKIFWTSFVWIIIVLGFAFYMKMFDANMALGVSTFLGATEITTSGETIPTTGDMDPVLSGVNAIQTTLLDMQMKLDTLVGTTTIPTVTPDTMTGTTTLPAVAPQKAN